MINIVVFSKDRAMQLELFIRSFNKYVKNSGRYTINILYTYSNNVFKEGYDKLIKYGINNVNFVKENNFKPDLIKLINKTAKYTIFFVDDKVSFFKTIIKYGILIVIDDEEHVTDFAIETLDAYAFLFNNGIKYMEYENRIIVDNWNDVKKNITCNKYHSK